MKTKMQRHFVIFESPGTFVHETTEKPIDTWNVAAAVKMADDITERHNSRPFAFYFVTRSRDEDDLDSKQTAHSARYFLGGQVFTLAEVKRLMPEKTTLISNMECNDYERIVINSNSWTIHQPLGPKDTVLDYTPPERKTA